ncbi:MAG: guanylate kinase [Acidobacteria bacterium]|nr:guanylate kinase [Acidobacteriota bacterium]
MLAAPRRGDLFVVSAPSGAGKTTLLKRLLRRVEGLEFSVSYTTRGARPGERDGVDYHFVGTARFRRMIRQREFLEWARVYGHLYGTGRREVDRILAAGRDVLLDLDTQGAAALRRRAPAAVLIFILPPDAASLGRRLRGRGQDAPPAVRRRLARAADEIRKFPRYDYLVVNDRVEDAVRRLEAVIRARRCERPRVQAEARRILRGF